MNVSKYSALFLIGLMIACGAEEASVDYIDDGQMVSSGAVLAKETPAPLVFQSPREGLTTVTRDDFEPDQLREIERPNRGLRPENAPPAPVGQTPGFDAFMAAIEPANPGRCERNQAERRGSGLPQLSTPSLIEFDTIEVDGPFQVFAEYGPTPSVMIRADDNILPVITAEARDNVLKIGMPSTSTCFGIQPTLYVRGPEFSHLRTMGQSAMEVFNAHGRHLTLDVGTQSRIAVHGRVNFVKVEVDRLGVAELQGLQASSAEIVMTTGASAELSIHKSVIGTIDAGSRLRLLRNVEEMNLDGEGTVEFDEAALIEREEGAQPGLN